MTLLGLTTVAVFVSWRTTDIYGNLNIYCKIKLTSCFTYFYYRTRSMNKPSRRAFEYCLEQRERCDDLESFKPFKLLGI